MSTTDARTPPQVVLVTGASSGIGRETALRYASRNACLALAARSQQTLNQVAEQYRTAGATEVVVLTTDIADAEQVHAMFVAAVAHFGRVDVAVQCAAITAFGRFEDLPIGVFDEIVRTNLLGTVNVARSALLEFQKAGSGHLVVIGSLLGIAAAPYQSAYVVSKFALQGLVRALRQENRHWSGIRIHGVYPGPVSTPVYATAANYMGRAPRIPPTAVAPGTVVSAIIRATERPRCSERQVGWMNRPAILVYHLIPSIYDAVIGPFLRKVAFAPWPIEPTNGNVFDPAPLGPGATVANRATRPAS